LDILSRLIPDERSRRRIKSLAEADARNWQFLGTEGYRHILSENIINAVEKASGESLCFVGPDEMGRFRDWYGLEKKLRCGNFGTERLKTAQNNASMGPHRSREQYIPLSPSWQGYYNITMERHQDTDPCGHKLLMQQGDLFKDQP
jgi:hypothetical protein